MRLTNFHPYSEGGAADDEFHRLVAWAQGDLSADYLGFMKETNGGDTNGNLTEYFRFWDANDVIAHNEGYEVKASQPSFIGIGDDGGPSMLLLKRRTGEVFRYPFSLDDYSAEKIAPSFTGLLAHIETLRPAEPERNESSHQ
ncbi:MAG: hypothetical protein JWL63_787 [Rhodocyclales bacterium]|nr:hypothetical protein [Rhodocyclales bacterium]